VTGIDITQHAETAYEFGSIHPVHAAAPGEGREMAARDAADQDQDLQPARHA
jgi:hypothetical protein